MKNIIIAGVIVIIGAGVFLTHPFKSRAPEVVDTGTTTPIENTESSTTPINNPTKIPATAEKLSATDLKTIQELKDVWDKYLTAAKAHDVDTTTSLSFQVSDSCQHLDKTQKECFALMDTLVSAFSDIKISDFRTAWYDSKQAILFSKQKPATLDGNIGFYQPRIYFGMKDGKYKVLSVFPNWGRFANKNIVKAANVQEFLQKGTLDSDKDGLTDMEENCDNGGGPDSIKNCKKTDPFVRDENKNGWWDGIEIYIRPITN